MNEIAHGEIGITVDDSTVDSQLTSVQTRYRLAMERIDRMEAKAKLGVDLDRLRAELKEAEADIKRFEKEYKTSSNESTKTAMVNAKRRADSLKGEIQQTQSLKRAENERIQVLRTTEQRVAANTRLVNDHAKALQSESAGHRDSALETARHNQEIARLERQYIKATDAREKFHRQTKTTTGEAQIKAEVNKAGALADMERIKAELNILGRHPPVGIRADIDLKTWEGVKARFGRSVESVVAKLSTISHVRLNLGPLSGTIRTFAIALTTLGPVVTSLTAGLGALIGVAGTGLAGAAVLGVAGLTGMGLAAAGAFLTIKPLVNQYKIASQATQAYHKAVLKFGEGSKQANKAQQQMNSTLKGVSPEVRKAAMEVTKFQATWAKLTSGRGGATRQFGGILSDATGSLGKLAPTLAAGTNQFAGTLRKSLGTVFKELGSQSAKSGIGNIFTRFNRSIPEAVGGLNHFGIAIGRISVSASRFLPMLTQGFGRMGTHFANATADSNHLDAVIGRLVHHAQDVMRMFGAAGHVLVDFFNTGANSGDRMVKSLTNTLNKWDQWIRSTKGQTSLHDFFERGRQGTDQFFRALLPLLKAFGEWSNALQPVTTGILSFVSGLTRAVSAVTHLAVAGPALKALGFTLAAIFVTSKVATWINLIRNAGAALGLFKTRSYEAAAAQNTLAASEGRAAAGASAEAAAAGRAGVAGAARGGPAAAARRGGRFGGIATAANAIPAVGVASVLAHDAQQVGKGHQIPSLTQGFGAVTGLKLPKAVNFAGPLLPVTGAIAGINALGKTLGIFDSGAKKASAFNNVLKQMSQGKISLAQATSEIQKLGGQTGKPAQVAKSMRQLNSEIGALKNGAAINLNDLRNRFTQNFTDIQAIMGSKSRGGRKAMDDNMNAAFNNLRQVLHDGRLHTATFLGQIKDIFSTNWRATGRITRDNLNNVVSTIRRGMKDGSIATKQGMKAIHDYSIQYLIRTLHIQPNNAELALERGGLDSAQSSGGGSTGTGGSGRSGGNAARGWIGNPGEAGPDNVDITVGRGEAVVNRHQQPIINYALQAIGMRGGLGELFDREQTPHYMARGGIVGEEKPAFASGGPITMRMSPHGVQGLAAESVLHTTVGLTNQRLKKIAEQGGPGGPAVQWGNTKVAGWISQILKWAQAHGWHGSVTEGFRSLAEQWAIWNSGQRPAAYPGTSMHGGLNYPEGAVDVTDPASLAAIIAGGPAWVQRLEWAGAKDTVHFSHPHGGRYAKGGWVYPQHWGRSGTGAGNIDQSTNLRTGQWAHGMATHFGPPAESGPSTGVSTPFGNARGGYWLMHSPNGNWAIERQTDAGPNLALKRMFDLTQGSMHDLGSGDGPGYQGMFLGRSTHGYHTGRIGKGQGAYLAAQLSGGRGPAEKLVTMWDDRNMTSATHPAAYWKRMDSKQPHARAHWHTTKRAAQKIFDRNKAKRTAANAPTATVDPNRGNTDNPNIVTGSEYPDLDLTIAREGGLDAAANPQGTPAERQALRDRISRDTSAINSDEGLLAFYEGIRKNHYKWGTTKQDKGFIDNSITSLQTSLTGLYGDRKQAQDLLGPMDIATALGITGASGADSGSGAGSAADNADLQAQLAQAQQRNVVLTQSGLISDAFARVAGGPGDLGIGGFTSTRMAAQQNDRPTIIVNTLHPGDPSTLLAIANAATAGMGYQGGRTSPRDATI